MKRFKEVLGKIGRFFYPNGDWSRRRKIFLSVVTALLLVSLVFSWTVFRPAKVAEKTPDVKDKSGTGLVQPPDQVVKEVIPATVLSEMSKLQGENANYRAKIAQLEAQISAPKPPGVAQAPAAIVWPKTDKFIRGDQGRKLLTDAFPNREWTGAHFELANLYNLEQFKEIRSKMPSVNPTGLTREEVIFTAIGMFQIPSIQRLPMGYAYPRGDSGYNRAYMLVFLEVSGQPKLFGFDPVQKDNIWEVGVDSSVIVAILF